MSALALLVLLAAEPKHVTLVFTGDNAGEVSPCGCEHNPIGGLPRRKTVLDKVKAPRVVLDAGNSLFRATGLNDPDARKRAAFVLETMGKLGVSAMALGERDLGAGVDFLKANAASSKVKLLSCNLKTGEKLAFEGSTVINTAGVQVGVIGLSPQGPVEGSPQLTGAEYVVSISAQVSSLHPRPDVIVLLAAIPYIEALSLSKQLQGSVDLIIQSGDMRGRLPPQRMEGNFLFSSGARGQAMGKLALQLDGPPVQFVDLDESVREGQLLAALDNKIAMLNNRLASATDDAAKAEMKKTLADFGERRAEQAKKVVGPPNVRVRSLKLDWLLLDTSVADDPALMEAVKTIEPSYSGAAH